MSNEVYKQKLCELSKALVQAQKPIRILDAVKWDPQTVEFFHKTKFKEMVKNLPELKGIFESEQNKDVVDIKIKIEK